MARKKTGLRELQELIRDEGLLKAYHALEKVLDNPNSPPTALASASSSMIKMGELLARDDSECKDPSEMTYDEIQEAIDRLRRDPDRSSSPVCGEVQDGLEPGVFD